LNLTLTTHSIRTKHSHKISLHIQVKLPTTNIYFILKFRSRFSFLLSTILLQYKTQLLHKPKQYTCLNPTPHIQTILPTISNAFHTKVSNVFSVLITFHIKIPILFQLQFSIKFPTTHFTLNFYSVLFLDHQSCSYLNFVSCLHSILTTLHFLFFAKRKRVRML